MYAITLPPKEKLKFVLLGAGFHLCEFARMLVRRGFELPVIVTWPRERHERDRQLLTDPKIYSYVFDVADELGIEVIEETRINEAHFIEQLETLGCNIAFSLSWRMLIKKDFMDAVGGRVFNIHPTLLPKERGSGTFSWRIMNDVREVSATVHIMDEKIDTGKVVFQLKDELKAERPRPADYLIETNRVYVKLLDRFLDRIEAHEPLNLSSQDEGKHTYLPRLYTEINGAIDWSWQVGEIERYIRAFSDPYPGAFTFVGDRRLVVHDAAVEESDIGYHPYVAGRVTSLLEDGTARIVANGGFLRLNRVTVDGEVMKPADALKYTDTLHTPYEVLERAKISVVQPSKMALPSVEGSE